jgi:hypothetical protein
MFWNGALLDERFAVPSDRLQVDAIGIRGLDFHDNGVTIREVPDPIVSNISDTPTVSSVFNSKSETPSCLVNDVL